MLADLVANHEDNGGLEHETRMASRSEDVMDGLFYFFSHFKSHDKLHKIKKKLANFGSLLVAKLLDENVIQSAHLSQTHTITFTQPLSSNLLKLNSLNEEQSQYVGQFEHFSLKSIRSSTYLDFSLPVHGKSATVALGENGPLS